MAELSVHGVGVAVADPEVRSVGQKQTSLCVVNLAFNRRYQDGNQQWQSEPCFLRVQAWGSRGDRMAELVKKGQPIYIDGYLKQDTWTTNEGSKRVSYSVVLKDFQLCEKNGKIENSKKNNNDQQTVSPTTNTYAEDDIPF